MLDERKLMLNREWTCLGLLADEIATTAHSIASVL